MGLPITPSLTTYNPKLVSVVIGGVPISGFAEDSVVEAERDKDAYNKVVGADGKATRTRIVNICGKFVIHLMQTSACNDYFSGLADLDEGADAGVVPILVRDASGRSLFSCPAAWVMKKTKADFAAEKANPRVWTFDCGPIPIFEVAGN